MSQEIKTRMTAEEYLHQPETMQRMELIAGEVIIHGDEIMSPAPLLDHQRYVGLAYRLLSDLIPNGEVFIAPVDVYLDEYNVVQPDILWVADSNDQCVAFEGKHLKGAPDLVIEVLSPSTSRYDRKDKFDLYQRFGVREYWMLDPVGRYIEVWGLKNDKFVRQGIYAPDEQFVSPVLGDKMIDLSKLFVG